MALLGLERDVAELIGPAMDFVGLSSQSLGVDDPEHVARDMAELHIEVSHHIVRAMRLHCSSTRQSADDRDDGTVIHTYEIRFLGTHHQR